MDKLGGHRQIGADMAFVLWLGLALIPFLLGKGFLALFYGKKYVQYGRIDAFLAGIPVGIGLTQAAHLAAVFFRLSLTDAVRIWNLFMAVMILMILFPIMLRKQKQKRNPALRRKRKQNAGKIQTTNSITTAQQILYLFLGVSIVLQVAVLASGQYLFRTGDMTLETVNSFLATDEIYQVNPLTGFAYEQGMPLRLKILSLPTLYGILCKNFNLSASLVIETMIPVAVLLASYLAFSRLAEVLFGNNRTQKVVFLLIVSILFWIGDYTHAMDGYTVMHWGYRGTTIRNLILVPYTISLCLQRKWRLTFLCILAEACIVWTLYGAGVCLIVTALLAAITGWTHYESRIKGEAAWNG